MNNKHEGDFIDRLFCAACAGDTATFKELIKYCKDINSCRTDGLHVTLLHCAVRNARPEICEVLLDAGANANLPDAEGNTAWALAIMRSSLACVELIMEHDEYIQAVDCHMRTPLHYAAANATFNGICSLLISKGADINAVDEIGRSPLHYASMHGNSAICRLLLKHGADIALEDASSNRPFDLACSNGHDYLGMLLRNHYMEIAINKKGTITEYNVLEYLDKKGVLSSTDILPAVTTEGLLSLVRIINSGLVSPRQAKEVLAGMIQDKEMDAAKAAEKLGYGGRDTCGDLETIIDNVVDECSDELLNEMLDKLVAKVMACCPSKPNPKCLKNIIVHKLGLITADKTKLNADLLQASYKGDLNLVMDLLSKGADVNTKDEDGETPLHLATRNGRTETCALLLERGAEANAKNKYGSTPLHAGACCGCTEICKLLLDHGADVKARNKFDRTPLHAAAWRGRTNTCKLLLAHGADVNAKDEHGWDPLHEAASKGYTGLCKLLRKYEAK